MSYTYEVIKETPGYHIDSYSDIEVVECFSDVKAAWDLCTELRRLAGESEWFYVTVTAGSIDNV